MPVLTKNKMGEGNAYYVATRSNEEFYHDFLGELCRELSVKPVANVPNGVEATMRENENGSFLFLLNHGDNTVNVVLDEDGEDLLTGKSYKAGDKITLTKTGVAILLHKK